MTDRDRFNEIEHSTKEAAIFLRERQITQGEEKANSDFLEILKQAEKDLIELQDKTPDALLQKDIMVFHLKFVEEYIKRFDVN